MQLNSTMAGLSELSPPEKRLIEGKALDNGGIISACANYISRYCGRVIDETLPAPHDVTDFRPFPSLLHHSKVSRISDAYCIPPSMHWYIITHYKRAPLIEQRGHIFPTPEIRTPHDVCPKGIQSGDNYRLHSVGMN